MSSDGQYGQAVYNMDKRWTRHKAVDPPRLCPAVDCDDGGSDSCCSPCYGTEQSRRTVMRNKREQNCICQGGKMEKEGIFRK